MTKDDGKVSHGLGLSRGTVRTVRNVLKSAFNFAVNNGLLAENPVTKTKLPPGRKTVANSLSIEEATAFVSVKEQYWYGNALVFQLHTGLRNQELMALIWDDVNFENGTLRIERACKWVRNICVEIGPPKTEKSNRVIKLEPEHLALLRLQLERQKEVIEKRKKLKTCYGDSKIKNWIISERPRQAHQYSETNLIFPKSDGKVPGGDTVRKKFKRMLRRAGVKDNGRKLRWYDLRHTHASIILAAGVPEHEVADRMGHSTAVLQEIYAHVLQERRGIPSRVFADLVPV